MTAKLEVAVRKGVRDSAAEAIKNRVKHDLGIELANIKTKRVYILDTALSKEELERAQKEIFMDPQVDVSSFEDLMMPYEWRVDIAWKPGVTDTTGRVSVEALEDLLGRELGENEKVYTSMQICLAGELTEEQVMKIAHLYANEVVQDKRVWGADTKPELFIPKVDFDIKPKVEHINLEKSDEELLKISKDRKLALNLGEMQAIRDYFRQQNVKEARETVGMPAMVTDVELEALAQTWSEHCKHKIFNAIITDRKENIFDDVLAPESALEEVIEADGMLGPDGIMIDSIFNTYIRIPALELQKKLPWVKSILKDNAGVVEFDKNWLYTLKWESHNSPSAKEPFGGAYTGIVGVFRDPMGTGRGGKIIAGFWSFHTGSPNYDGELVPELYPLQILEGVRAGVEAGGNRSGNPTVYGFTYFDEGFIGKPYIGVGASSLIPKEIGGEPGWEKIIEPGDLAIVIGGRVGIDGIHGATESSLEGGKHISASHVQIGDAYMQKKVQEFLIEARDAKFFKGVQDFGAGGISSAFGELAEFTNGLMMDIGKHPTKYTGLMPWQIYVSESQERMGLAAKPEKLEALVALAKKHDIELTVLGQFNNNGWLKVTHNDMPCVYLDMEFLHSGGPGFELEAEWLTPEERGLVEPQLPEVKDHTALLKLLLSRENIASVNYIVRQFDHEVQGGSVIKPLTGVLEDVHGDASVVRPILDSFKGIAYSAGDNPQFGKIDTYWMTLCNIDEAIRRVITVGGNLKQIPLNDNFGWPSPLPGENNPDAKYKTAQLVRAAKAVADGMRAYGAPCISGKDSMSMDGTIKTKNGNEQRVSAPPIVQMSTAALIEDVRYCLSMDAKQPGDLVYILGTTKDELGGSEYYNVMGELGLNVPKVDVEKNIEIYNAHSQAAKELLLESSHGIYRGGLGVHLALVSIASLRGLEIDLSKVPTDCPLSDEKIFYSESAGRLIVTVDPKNKERFETLMNGKTYACIGQVLETPKDGHPYFKVHNLKGELIINEPLSRLREVYHSTFDGELNATA